MSGIYIINKVKKQELLSFYINIEKKHKLKNEKQNVTLICIYLIYLNVSSSCRLCKYSFSIRLSLWFPWNELPITLVLFISCLLSFFNLFFKSPSGNGNNIFQNGIAEQWKSLTSEKVKKISAYKTQFYILVFFLQLRTG